LFEAMKMERAVIGLIVLLVTIVAVGNILTTLFVSVSQKQRDISILKALGATNGQIRRLFVQQAFFMGLIGGLIGAAMALAISSMLERYQFIDLPDLYMLASLPISYDWRVYSAVMLAGLIFSVIAALYPSIVATRVSPTSGIRGTAPTV